MNKKNYRLEKERISRQKRLYDNMVNKIQEYKRRVKKGEIDSRERYNLIDPESKIMRGENRYTYIQGYNAKLMISNNDIILNYRADTEPEKYSARGMIKRVEDMKRKFGGNHDTKFLLDSGFENMKTILDCEKKGLDLYIDLRKKTYSKNAQKRKYFDEVEKQSDGFYLSCIGGRRLKGTIFKDKTKVSFGFHRKGCIKCFNFNECYKRLKPTTKSKTICFDMVELENKKGIGKYLKKINSCAGRKIYHRRIGKEHVFSNIKNQKGYFQTVYRGIKKVNMELSWISLAHNLMKYVNLIV